MAFNGSGTYNLPSGNPVVTGTTISSTWANTTLADIASALTNCVTRDGQSPATGNLPMGNYKLTGLAQASASGDALGWGLNANVSGLVVGSLSGLLKASTGTVSAATSGTDYAPATSGTGILKGDGSGGFSTATSGTDYVIPSGTVALSTNCTNAIGYGQTWQSVGSSRAWNTNYTNSTGKPIMLAIFLQFSSTSQYASVYIGASPVYSVGGFTGNSTITIIIPAGSVYQLSGGSPYPSIYSWYELR